MLATVAPTQRTASLDIGVQRLVGLAEVCLDGALVETTVPALCDILEALLAVGASDLEVDCTELVEIDGFGLSVLLDAGRQASRAGGNLVLRYVQPSLVLRLRLAGLADLLPVA